MRFAPQGFRAQARQLASSAAVRVDTCTGCGNPAHASETDDDGYHPQCRPVATSASDLAAEIAWDREMAEACAAESAQRSTGARQLGYANLRVDALINGHTSIDGSWTEQDFADLAVAAADQAGANAHDQQRIAALIPTTETK